MKKVCHKCGENEDMVTLNEANDIVLCSQCHDAQQEVVPVKIFTKVLTWKEVEEIKARSAMAAEVSVDVVYSLINTIEAGGPR